MSLGLYLPKKLLAQWAIIASIGAPATVTAAVYYEARYVGAR
jgi:hypothetical protein